MVLAALAGCSDPVGPIARTVRVTPDLSSLEVDRLRIRPGGILGVYATPGDLSFRLRDNEYVRISAQTSAGEYEDLSLEPAFCSTPGVTIYYCHAMGVGMHDGHHITDIEPALNTMNVRLTLVFPSGLGGGAWDFSGNLDAAMRRVRRLPGVKIVEHNALFLATLSDDDIFSTLAGALPLDNLPPVARDGHLQLQPGDTLVVSYGQPGGSWLSDTVVTSALTEEARP